MQTPRPINFYARKPTTLPRFVYRRLAQALQTAEDRAKALEAAIGELVESRDPNLRKFKFTLPPFLRRQLSPEETQLFNEKTRQRRERAAQLKMVYPHAADEFSLDRDFLLSVLDMDGGPRAPTGGRFYTVGSCFARNIAEYLVSNGRHAGTFALTEDLNSPISNAFIFDLLRRAPEERLAAVSGWVARVFPEYSADQVRQVAEEKTANIGQLALRLGEADCVVLTLGNVVDFFWQAARDGQPLMQNVAPKFIALPGEEDIGLRSNAAARLKQLGATLRLASYEETKQAIAICLQGIREVTSAPIVVTLSPVPVDSVIGLASNLKTAIEVDCVSKSRLRSAFDDVAVEFAAGGDDSIHYFPSFEIVRWIAPMLAIPTFGLEDAGSRHVSSPILQAVCALFVESFVQWPDAETQPQRPGLAQVEG